MMRTIILTLALLLGATSIAYAQDSGKLSYFPVVTGKEIPEASKRALTAKMEQITAKNGYGSINHADRFLFVARCNVSEKDVTPTTPPRIRQELEITFILGDVVENKIYASESFDLKGIGINETKAWQTAINNLKPDNEKLSKLFEEAVGKIESYYRENCESIIAQAHAAASSGNYDEAIASLMAVPDICDKCHAKAMDEAVNIYQEKIDMEGTSLMKKARNIWAASMDQKGAKESLTYINSINPQSAAFSEIEALVNEISEKLSSDKQREWEQHIKRYNDEKAYRNREQINSHARSMATIAAARSIAEKWAENQPETKVYYNW